MQETTLPRHAQGKSPAGADVRVLLDSQPGGMIHSTVRAMQTSRAIVHKTVTELWFILEGRGEIWRSDFKRDLVTTLEPNVSIEITVGTRFQYRNVGDKPLRFICVTMPPWPGEDEVIFVDGPWEPTV